MTTAELARLSQSQLLYRRHVLARAFTRCTDRDGQEQLLLELMKVNTEIELREAGA